MLDDAAPIAPDDPTAAAVATVAGELRADEGIYVQFRRDTRRCASPWCGGYWYNEVNRRNSTCTDGSRARECYVFDIDWGGVPEPTIPISGDGVIVQGFTQPAGLEVAPEMHNFHAYHAWEPLAEDAAAGGHTFRVRDTGIVCVTAPCFDIQAYVPNRRRGFMLSELDGSAVEATPAETRILRRALRTGRLLVRGEVETNPGRAVEPRSRTLTANQVYLPVLRD